MINGFYLLLIMIISGSLGEYSIQLNKNHLAYKKIVIDTSEMSRFPINCSIRAIEAIDDNTMWFAGSNGMYGYTEDGGLSWYIDSLAHPDHNELQFRSIAITSHSVFLLCIGSPAIMYKSDDKGKNWEIVYEDHDTLAFYDAMAFWDDDEGIAMGDPTSGCITVIKTFDGGASWHKIKCNDLPPAYDGEAAFAASNSNIALYGDNAWIVSGGSKARVFRSIDKGNTWNVSETPIIQGGQMTGIFSVDFFDPQNGIIIGGDWNEKSSNFKNKAYSNDGGISWSLIADGENPGYRSCVGYIHPNSPDYIMAVGIPGISLSSDRGKSWKQISDEGFYTFRIAGQTVWMAGSDIIARLPISWN